MGLRGFEPRTTCTPSTYHAKLDHSPDKRETAAMDLLNFAFASIIREYVINAKELRIRKADSFRPWSNLENIILWHQGA